MNRHTKLAIILAPFLAIGGYIASGYYVESQNNKERFLKLIPQSDCNIIQGDCKLGNGKFLLNLAKKTDGVHLATTHPIDHAVISLVTGSEQEELYKLRPNGDRLNWKTESPLFTKTLDDTGNKAIQKIRLLLTIKKTSYLAEIDALSASK